LLALARIPGESVCEALLKALPSSRGRTQLEILDTLSDRCDAHSLPAFLERLNSPDPAVAEISALALAKLADPRAVQALRQAYTQAPGAARVPLGQSLIECAYRLRRRGEMGSAWMLYDLLDREPASPAISAAVLRGRMQIGGER